MPLNGVYSLNKGCSSVRNENEVQHNTKSRISNLVNNPTNSEVNLIDLLDNVCISQVTTHANDKEKQIADYQLKMLEEFLSTSKQKQEQTELQETELRLFFDKYEDIKPESETSLQLNYQEPTFQQSESIPDRIKDCACAFNFDEAPKVLVPKLEEPNKIELVDRELDEPIDIDLADREFKINEDLIDEVLFDQVLEKRRLTNRNATLNYIEKKHKTRFDRIPPANNITKMLTPMDSKSYNNNIFDEIVNNNKVKYFETSINKNVQTAEVLNAHASSTIHLEKDKNKAIDTKTKTEQKALNNDLVMKHNIKYLEAVKKVEKIFQKRSTLVLDAEKSKLTPGPSLYEKTVALPRIMESFNERQKTLETRNTLKMRLILDAGSSITMEKPGPLRTAQDSQHRLLKTPVSIGLDPLNDITVLTPPQSLMVDCNRERLKVFETGKIFSNFVRNGNYFRQ